MTDLQSLNLFDIDTLGDPHAGVGEDHEKLSVNQEVRNICVQL